MDKRWKELGKLLVNYSTSVQPNERVMIAMTEIETYPLVQAVYEACVHRRSPTGAISIGRIKSFFAQIWF